MGTENIILYRGINRECSSIIFIPKQKKWLQTKVSQTETIQDLPGVHYSKSMMCHSAPCDFRACQSMIKTGDYFSNMNRPHVSVSHTISPFTFSLSTCSWSTYCEHPTWHQILVQMIHCENPVKDRCEEIVLVVCSWMFLNSQQIHCLSLTLTSSYSIVACYQLVCIANMGQETYYLEFFNYK